MIAVDEAVARIIAAFRPLEAETVPLESAAGRVLARDVVAQQGQPPFPVSAMDGYAVRPPMSPRFRRNFASWELHRRVIRSTASCRRAKPCASSPAASCPTAPMRSSSRKTPNLRAPLSRSGSASCRRHIRRAGLDFAQGDVLAAAGRRLGARDLSLIAAGDIATVAVRRRPRVFFAATGDELSRPGEARKPGGIVASSGYGLGA